MPEAKKADYEKAAAYAKGLENYLGNFANGMKYHVEDLPDDIQNDFLGIAAEIRRHADKLRKLKKKYQGKSQNSKEA
ncbi:MAG: hypothetical protein Q7S53_04695 [bacterium]|nr:hypothetical protein [bacterium]